MTNSSRWPRGTGQWNSTKAVIVSSDHRVRDRLARIWSEQFDVDVVPTPLELIHRLETEGLRISTVVLADVVGSVDARGLFEFLDACYPWVRLIAIEDTTQLDQDHEMQSQAAC